MTNPNVKNDPAQQLDIPEFQASLTKLIENYLKTNDQIVFTDMLELCVDAFEKTQTPEEARDIAIAIQMTHLDIQTKNQLVAIASRAVFEKPEDAIRAIDATKFQVRKDIGTGLRSARFGAKNRAKLIALETRRALQTRGGFNPRAIFG